MQIQLKKFQSIFLALILLCLTVACSSKEGNNSAPSSSKNCQSVRHDLGETKVCDRPQKIVAIGPNMLEILLTLGVQPLGYADYFPLPFPKFDRPSQQILFLGERVTSEPINIGSADNPSLETIARLEPDLILGDVYANEDEYKLLSQIAPTLLYTYAVDDTWQEQMRSIAQVLGKTEEAERAIAEHTRRIDRTKEALKPVVAKYPRLLLLGSERLEQGVQIDPYNHDSYCSQLLTDVGFKIVVPANAEGKEGQGGNVSLELLPQLAADSILVEAYSTDVSNTKEDALDNQILSVKQQWKNNAIAQSLSPSKNDRVYFTSAYLCRALPGPIGAEIFLDRLQQQLLPSDRSLR